MSAPDLRPVGSADQPFLYQLFCASRPELAFLPDPLCQLQFQAQVRGYSAQFPEADDHLILMLGRPVGRLLVDRQGAGLHLIDIALLPAEQGQGIGTALLQSLQSEAARAALPLTLSVFETNPARRLYERLGFAVTGAQPPYLAMQWLPNRGGTA